MKVLRKRNRFGKTDFSVPPIVFGTSCLGNLYQELPYETKLAIVSEWFDYIKPPVVADTAGKYGAGLALEALGETLSGLQISSDDVLISNKLGWKQVPLKGPEQTFEPGVWVGIENDAEQAISYEGIVGCFEQGCELLGEGYRTELVSVHDPDEYLAAASDAADKDRRMEDIAGAYRALSELKAAGKVKAVGVGAKDWKVIRELWRSVELDWVMFACSLTIYTHSAELLGFMAQLNKQDVAMINSAVFNAGFLTGGAYFDYRQVDAVKEPRLFQWRDEFFRVCKKHNVTPAAACVQFGLSVPGVAAVALNTSRPERVKDNVEFVMTQLPQDFWRDMKQNGLIAEDYPYLGN